MDNFTCPPDAHGQFPLTHILANAPEGADRQVLTAWALAFAFGHGWATLGKSHGLGGPAPDAAAWTDGQRNVWPCAIPISWEAAKAGYNAEQEAAPGEDIGVYPHHEHVSHSGRVQWSIASDGRVTIVIQRPSGAVCGLRPDGVIWRAKPGSATGAPEARHLSALSWCLSALGHPEAGKYADLAAKRLAAERAACGAAPTGYDPRWDAARNAPSDWRGPYTEIAPVGSPFGEELEAGA